nr:RNA-directed DNA polymerase, eukaryota, reverse transcriptase zinc-binding domain protein [Tanacetum cinerariifolium]
MKALFTQHKCESALLVTKPTWVADTTWDEMLKSSHTAFILCLGDRVQWELEDVFATLNSRELHKMTKVKGDAGGPYHMTYKRDYLFDIEEYDDDNVLRGEGSSWELAIVLLLDVPCAFVASFGNEGLNIRSLREKNLALLGKWWWRFRREGGSLWARVIKIIHGKSEGLGEVRVLGGRSLRGGVWSDIVRIGEEIDGLGIEFTSSFFGKLGIRRDIRFWVDRWVNHRRLCDGFLRLYHLDMSREGSVFDKGSRRWMLDDDWEFTVKELARLVEEKMLHTDSGGQETIWNKLVPKKVNIFVWRALKGRLPVHVELDRRDIDLDSVLCPCCVNAFFFDEVFASSGGVNVPILLSRVCQAVIWTSRSKKYGALDWQQWLWDPQIIRIH